MSLSEMVWPWLIGVLVFSLVAAVLPFVHFYWWCTTTTPEQKLLWAMRQRTPR